VHVLSVAGHKRAFGEDLVPGCYEDFELADMIVLVGSNTAWCHPTLFQRIRARRKRARMQVVVIDPRRTATCDLADLHLPVKPGTDVWLFNGLLSYLAAHGASIDFVERAYRRPGRRAGCGRRLRRPGSTWRACRIDPAQLLAFYELFAATEKVVTALFAWA
jgi:assimilatory nitrate reductase catalytic subunit